MLDRAAEPVDRARVFDASAGLYSTTFPVIWRFGFRALHRWVARELAGCRVILDAGTGPAYWAAFVASTSRKRVVGLDFSPAYLRYARRRVGKLPVDLVQADLTAAPFRDHSFDAVLCFGVLDTFPDAGPALAEFRRLLHRGGKALLVLRGRGSAASAVLERLFRFSVGAMRVLRSRSLGAYRLPASVWRREPLWRELPALAAANGMEVQSLDAKSLVTRVVLVKGL